MFRKLIEKIRNFFSPSRSEVGSVVPEKKQTTVTLGRKFGSNITPAMVRAQRPTPPPPPPTRTQPRRVETSVRQSAVSSGGTNHQSSGIDPLTAGLVGYMIGSSGDNSAPVTPAREYVYMGDGMMEEVLNKPQPVVCEPAPVFDSPTPSAYEPVSSYEPPSHTPSYESSYSSSDSYSSSSSDYSSSSYDSGSYDSGSSSSFD